MKLSLQILDAGETFFHPLDAETCVIGSAEGVSLRLREAGVAEQHAKIEIDPSGVHRLVDLGSPGGTRVNGRDVAQTRLSIGDRIEIGASVLVVGQHVPRKATPADVLGDGVALAHGQAELRRRRHEGDADPRRRRLAVAVGVLAVAVCFSIWFLAQSADSLPRGWGDLMRMRRAGDLVGARASIARYRGEWAGDDAARNARLDQIDADLRAIADAVAAGRVRLREEAATRSTAQQLDELRARRSADEDSIDGIAARVLGVQLHEIRDGVATVFPDRPIVPDTTGSAEPTQPRETPPPPPVVPIAGETAPAGVKAPAPVAQPEADAALFKEQLASLDRLRQLGRYSEALELCRIALDGASQERSAQIRDAELSLLDAARSELPSILKRIDEFAAAKPSANQPTAGLDQALVAVRVEIARFPSSPEFGALVERQRSFEIGRENALRGIASAGPSLLDLRDRLADARGAERRGDYARAAEVVDSVAAAVAQGDEAHARSLQGRAVDLRRLDALAKWFGAELAAGREVVFTGNDGETIAVTSRDGRLCAGDEPFRFEDVKPSALVDSLRQKKVPADLMLAAAVAAYRGGERELAESALADAVTREAALQSQVDGVIARGRGETLDASGYRLVEGAFVATRELEARKRAVELGPIVQRIARSGANRRDADLEQLLQKGPRELAAVVLALHSAATDTAARIERDAFRRTWDALATQRRKLDDARAHSKALIFDETRYFYPYKPPAVSAERASEYWKVQGEVDDRVAALRAIWDGGPAGKRVPKKLLDELAAFDWIQSTMTGFGERALDTEDRVAWARSLPLDEPLDLRTFAWDQADRASLDTSRRILALAQKHAAWMTRAERDVFELTNAYRVMFGHRPLAVNQKLVQAARGHAKEMASLGYFSHFSPIPEHRTPFDRMRLAGYAMGSSENIANHPTSGSAFDAWLHSSGHHRNILAAGHRELACGNDASLWVQNFGGGEEYLDDPEFRAGR